MITEETMAAFLHRRQPHSTTLSGVYFVKWGEYIKIGCARDIVLRFRGLSRSIPVGAFEALGWIYCYGRQTQYLLEDHVHRELSVYRVRGEWFRDCPEVRAYLDRHGMPWPLTLA